MDPKKSVRVSYIIPFKVTPWVYPGIPLKIHSRIFLRVPSGTTAGFPPEGLDAFLL